MKDRDIVIAIKNQITPLYIDYITERRNLMMKELEIEDETDPTIQQFTRVLIEIQCKAILEK